MSEWISVKDRLPAHGQKVKTKGKDGRVFDCDFWLWNHTPSFKLIGKVWDHDNVIEWMPLPKDKAND